MPGVRRCAPSSGGVPELRDAGDELVLPWDFVATAPTVLTSSTASFELKAAPATDRGCAMVSPPSNPELCRALERFVSSGSVTSEVREEVAASWARAVSFGLRPDRLDSPWDPDLDSGGRPAKAARPVLDKIGGDLVGTGISLLLTDERGHVLQRRVTDRGLRAQLDRILLVPGLSYGEEHTGTNAIGTTLDRRRPTVARGASTSPRLSPSWRARRRRSGTRVPERSWGSLT